MNGNVRLNPLFAHEYIRSYIMTWAYTCSYVLTKLAIVARSFLYEENSGLATTDQRAGLHGDCLQLHTDTHRWLYVDTYLI